MRSFVLNFVGIYRVVGTAAYTFNVSLAMREAEKKVATRAWPRRPIIRASSGWERSRRIF